MSSKLKKREPGTRHRASGIGRKKAVAVSPSPMPDARCLMPDFSRWQTRLWLSLAVRIVALGILTALLAAGSPWLRDNRVLMDAVSGILALWPFFAGWGKLQAARITLGRKRAEAGQWADADAVLSPLDNPQGRYFDATGEGRYWLAVARRENGKSEDARRLFATVAQIPGGEWAEKARREKESGGVNGGK